MGRIGETLTEISGQVALDSAADVYTFAPGRPVRIIRFGYIIDSATTTAPESLDLALDKRVTIGSNTGRLAGPSIAGAAGEAQGDGGYGNLDDQRIELDADEEVVFQVENAMTAGDGRVFCEYQPLPFVAGGDNDLGDLTSKTVTA